MSAHDRSMARLASDPLIARMFADYARMNNERETAAAKADPAAHKLSRVFDGGPRYRYWRAGRDARGREVRFCWSTNRNVAGYFLAWREVIGKTSSKRDQWAARKSRAACTELAARRQNAWIDKATTDPPP